MSDPSTAPLRRNVGLSLLALGASGGTLICCLLPAVLVALGAGATLAGIVTAVPQLVWLSEHKGWVFGIAGVMLAMSGMALWMARALSCPADPAAARTCARLRRTSLVLWWVAIISTTLGAAFAFLLPRL